MSNGGSYDHYELLGVTPAATTEEINAAYRTLAKRLHPDVVGDTSTALFAMVADARAVLTDPERRARYDRFRNRTVAPKWTEPTRAPEPDYVAEDIPPRPPHPSEDTGWRSSSYPPPAYQTYFGRSSSYPPPAYQTYFGRPGNLRPPTEHRPGPMPPSPGGRLLHIVRGFAKATTRYTNRKPR